MKVHNTYEREIENYLKYETGKVSVGIKVELTEKTIMQLDRMFDTQTLKLKKELKSESGVIIESVLILGGGVVCQTKYDVLLHLISFTQESQRQLRDVLLLNRLYKW